MFFGERSSLHTAWYVGHRLRAGMKDDNFKKLMGIVEVDETGIGGKDKNRHWDKKSTSREMSGKITVIGAISRKGNVTCQIIENAMRPTLNRFIRKAVSDKVRLVATDDYSGIAMLGRRMPHDTVNHAKDEYVRGQRPY